MVIIIATSRCEKVSGRGRLDPFSAGGGGRQGDGQSIEVRVDGDQLLAAERQDTLALLRVGRYTQKAVTGSSSLEKSRQLADRSHDRDAIQGTALFVRIVIHNSAD